MGQKDISEKMLEAYNEVFADIINVLLFDGENIIDPEELESMPTRSFYKTDEKIREMERDMVKKWKKGNMVFSCIGIENQTTEDNNMPLRVAGYDGAVYRSQLDGTERYPVITIVLYFNAKKRWQKAKSLQESIHISEILRPFVNDIRINVYDIAFLSREQVDKFRSDFWYVADYFVQKHETGEYKPAAKDIVHIEEVLQLLSIMAEDHRFEETYRESIAEGKGIKNMCEVLDKIENKGREEGKLAGIAEGKLVGSQEKARETAQRLLEIGMDKEQIAEMVGVDFETVKTWLA